jgi:hypothetical protein
MLPFAEYCERVKAHIEGAYGIPVITRDVPDPLTGDLNGAEIHIDYAVTPEQRLFLLAHLFGHTVQWNMNPDAYELGQPRQPPVKEDVHPLMALGGVAAAMRPYAMTPASPSRSRLSDYTACDIAQWSHYHRPVRETLRASGGRDSNIQVVANYPKIRFDQAGAAHDGVVI